jgi:hypothetical protein
MPELLWKAYIDFETDEGEREAARALYERLVALSGHVKVWISYALFEAEAIPVARALREEEEEGLEDGEAEQMTVDGNLTFAREVFERGYRDLRSKGLKAEVCGGFVFVLLRRWLMLRLVSAWLYWMCGRRSRSGMGHRKMWHMCRG